MDSNAPKISRATKIMAVVRLFFGTLQVMGATMGLIFLVETGVTNLTVVTISITLVISIASRILFSKAR